jgi:guanosine-3',5'-bis(diphosphate) 3'-pyrophosphohydrolase
VHTDVGNRCVAAKIDRRDVPLRTQLNNGETVEIITARSARPNPSWIEYVVTAKARNAIRAQLKRLKSEEATDLGRRLLSQALRPYSLSLRKLKKARINTVLGELEVADMRALYEQLGLGERLAPVVARQLAESELAVDHDPSKRREPLEVAGGEGLVVSYAKCCYPIPGDEIVGFISSGRGIVIHRSECRNLTEFRNHPSKWIPVAWKARSKSEFLAEIQVRTMDRVGLLAEIAARISATQSNIDFVRVDTETDAAVQVFRLKVRDRRHLAQVIRGLRTIHGVLRVSRTGN